MIPVTQSPSVEIKISEIAKKWIGEATMELDGTIRMRIRMEYHGTIGDSLKIYRSDDPEYLRICAHLPNLKPGTSVPIYNDWNGRGASGR